MRIVHVYDSSAESPYAVYIGRGTIYENPFKLGIDGGRDEVIKKFEVYARNRLKVDGRYRLAIKNLKGMILACHCAPKRCHGEVLARLSLELNKC